MEHDELIDRAIASYTEEGPPAGFDTRVLQKIGFKRRLWWWAVVPVAAGAAACALWMVPVNQPDATPVRIARVSKSIFKKPVPELAEAHKPIRKRRALVKTAVSLTGQERALVNWVAQSPETAAREWTAMKERMEMPIEIKILELQPIAIEEQEK